ncbi:MAG: TIGR03936 family radical SAM-associated protein [Lachnospiraceae bacterium]
MRSFQRGFIRAGVKMIYSEGFNPHQKMNFAQPLGVGVTSSGEYMDVEIAPGQDLTQVKDLLQVQMGEGFNILGITDLADNAPKAMAAVKYASYRVTVTGPCPDIEEFLKADEVLMMKKTKSGNKSVNIRPLVHMLTRTDNMYEMLVNAGGENNLKPELLMRALFELEGTEYDRSMLSIKRLELLSEGFVPLDRKGD